MNYAILKRFFLMSTSPDALLSCIKPLTLPAAVNILNRAAWQLGVKGF